MMLSTALAVCTLSTFVAAAASFFGTAAVDAPYRNIGLDGYNIQHGEGIMQARDASDWKSTRIMFIGVGNVKQNVGDLSRNLQLQGKVRDAFDSLCKEGGFGFDMCDTQHWWEVNIDNIKAKLKISFGAAYWPYGHSGLREALIKAVAETVQTAAENNCFDEGGKGNLCSAPDKVFVRVDYIGWLVVIIKSDEWDGPNLDNCDSKEVEKDNGNKISDWVKGSSRPDVAKALSINADDIDVQVRCYVGTEPAGEGNGWCRDKKGFKNKC